MLRPNCRTKCGQARTTTGSTRPPRRGPGQTSSSVPPPPRGVPNLPRRTPPTRSRGGCSTSSRAPRSRNPPLTATDRVQGELAALEEERGHPHRQGRRPRPAAARELRRVASRKPVAQPRSQAVVTGQANSSPRCEQPGRGSAAVAVDALAIGFAPRDAMGAAVTPVGTGGHLDGSGRNQHHQHQESIMSAPPARRSRSGDVLSAPDRRANTQVHPGRCWAGCGTSAGPWNGKVARMRPEFRGSRRTVRARPRHRGGSCDQRTVELRGHQGLRLRWRSACSALTS